MTDGHIARAELILARRASLPLADAGLKPDPLQPLARVFRSLRDDLDEHASVIVDVCPATPGRRRRLRRRLLREARAQEQGRLRAVLLRDLEPEGGASSRDRTSPVDLLERRIELAGLESKLGAGAPLVEVQLLVRVESHERGAAKAHLQALLACFDAFAGENHLRARGLGVPGRLFLGADLPGRRRSFDKRVTSGLFRPPRRNVLTPREIAGLLKPPTTHCAAPNVVRLDGVIPPPPPELPTFDHERQLVPLGRVSGETGERIVGLHLADTYFSYTAGRSRYGKTETAIAQFVHLARSGHGGLFLDPHEDAVDKIKTYLTDAGLAERVIEVNLAGRAGRERQPGWNLFDMEGLGAEDAERKVEAVVDAFASALRWDERNNRALTLTTQAAQTLIELAQVLPPETQPTLFQIPTLLSNDDWRTAVLPFVSPATRQFFTDRFERLPAEAITPVTNLIDRLRASTPVAALLGASQSSYDIRRAMDDGLVVLACPGSVGSRDRLIANFLVYDLLHAALGRAELAPAKRRPFYVFLDEVQTYDGASSGNLAALLEQTAKCGIRAFLFNQNPERLTQATWNAVTTNRSHLVSTVVNAHAASLIAREWGGSPDATTISRLPRYTFLASVTLGNATPPPFLVRGVRADELFEEGHRPDRVGELDQAIDATMARKECAETIAQLDGLDRAILNKLKQRRGRGKGSQDQGAEGTVLPALPAKGDSAEGGRRRASRRRSGDFALRARGRGTRLHLPAPARLDPPTPPDGRAARVGAADAAPARAARRARPRAVRPRARRAASADAPLVPGGRRRGGRRGGRDSNRAAAQAPQPRAGRRAAAGAHDRRQRGRALLPPRRAPARARGWRSWRHELGHPITTGGRSAQLVIPDAVLGYPLDGRDERVVFHHAFIELDRGTIPIDALAHKLGRYARLYRHLAPAAEPAGDPRPRWRERYQRFPRILVVLAGKERQVLDRRLRTAIALCETEPQLTDEPDVSVSFCVLEDLIGEGPFRRVFIEARNPGRWVDWLGRAKAARRA